MAQKSTQAVDAILVGVADKSPLIQAALKQILSEDERFTLVHVSAVVRTSLKTWQKRGSTSVSSAGFSVPVTAV